MKDGFIYVFENFIYVPIISAIIGAIFSIIVPQIWTKIWGKIKKRERVFYTTSPKMRNPCQFSSWQGFIFMIQRF